VLTADLGSGYVVDPHHISTVKSDGITAPNVVRVELGDLDVLDDDVVGAGNNTETLALDHTAAALADDGLLGSNSDAENTSVVVVDAGLRGVGLVVRALQSVSTFSRHL